MPVEKITNALVLILLIEMMAGVGLSVSLREAASVLKNVRLVARGRLVNYFLVPAIANLLLYLFQAKPMVAAGWFAAGQSVDLRKAIGLTTATRNAGVALVIGTTSFPDTAAVSAVVVFAIFQTVLLVLLRCPWAGLFPHAPSIRCGRCKMLSRDQRFGLRMRSGCARDSAAANCSRVVRLA